MEGIIRSRLFGRRIDWRLGCRGFGGGVASLVIFSMAERPTVFSLRSTGWRLGHIFGLIEQSKVSKRVII